MELSTFAIYGACKTEADAAQTRHLHDAHADPGHDADAADVLHYLLMERSTIGAGLIYWEAYL